MVCFITHDVIMLPCLFMLSISIPQKVVPGVMATLYPTESGMIPSMSENICHCANSSLTEALSVHVASEFASHRDHTIIAHHPIIPFDTMIHKSLFVASTQGCI